MKASNFVYDLQVGIFPDLTPAGRGAISYRRAKKAGWWGDGSPLKPRHEWRNIVRAGRQQALEYWGPMYTK